MYSRDKILVECLKEMFRRVGERYPNKKFTNQDRWYAMRAWSDESEKDFKGWLVQYLKKRMRLSLEAAMKEVSYFLLMYGWRTVHDDGCLTILGKEQRAKAQKGRPV